MGYGEVGGNGSVEWKIDVGDADWTSDEKKSGTGHRQGGADKHGKPDTEEFTISVEVPRKESDPDAYLKKLAAALKLDKTTRRVYFTLQIESHNPDQIRIAWPPDPPLPASVGRGY